MKTDFLIVLGLPRCGTTFLSYQFSKHPSYSSSVRKEIDFFTSNYERGLTWYINQFIDQERIKVDISPTYFFSKETQHRIKNDLNNPKLVLGLRPLEEWFISFYDYISGFNDSILFEEFLAGFDWKVGGKIIKLKFYDGFFQERVESLLGDFNSESLYVFSYNKLKNNPLDLLNDIEKFCNSNSFFNKNNFENKIINARTISKNKSFLQIQNIEWLRELIFSIIPSRLIKRLRLYFYEKASENVQLIENPNDYRIEIIKKKFPKDIAFINSLN